MTMQHWNNFFPRQYNANHIPYNFEYQTEVTDNRLHGYIQQCMANSFNAMSVTTTYNQMLYQSQRNQHRVLYGTTNNQLNARTSNIFYNNASCVSTASDPIHRKVADDAIYGETVKKHVNSRTSTDTDTIHRNSKCSKPNPPENESKREETRKYTKCKDSSKYEDIADTGVSKNTEENETSAYVDEMITKLRESTRGICKVRGKATSSLEDFRYTIKSLRQTLKSNSSTIMRSSEDKDVNIQELERKKTYDIVENCPENTNRIQLTPKKNQIGSGKPNFDNFPENSHACPVSLIGTVPSTSIASCSNILHKKLTNVRDESIRKMLKIECSELNTTPVVLTDDGNRTEVGNSESLSYPKLNLKILKQRLKSEVPTFRWKHSAKMLRASAVSIIEKTLKAKSNVNVNIDVSMSDTLPHSKLLKFEELKSNAAIVCDNNGIEAPYDTMFAFESSNCVKLKQPFRTRLRRKARKSWKKSLEKWLDEGGKCSNPILLKSVNDVHDESCDEGESDMCTQGESDMCTQGESDICTQGESDICTQGESDICTQGKSDTCTQGESDTCTQGESDMCTQGESDVCTQGESDVCTQGESDVCTQGESDVCTQGESDICTQGESDMCTQGESDMCTQGESDMCTQGESDMCTQGESDICTQGESDICTQGESDHAVNGETRHAVKGGSGHVKGESGSAVKGEQCTGGIFSPVSSYGWDDVKKAFHKVSLGAIMWMEQNNVWIDNKLSDDEKKLKTALNRVKRDIKKRKRKLKRDAKLKYKVLWETDTFVWKVDNTRNRKLVLEYKHT